MLCVITISEWSDFEILGENNDHDLKWLSHKNHTQLSLLHLEKLIHATTVGMVELLTAIHTQNQSGCKPLNLENDKLWKGVRRHCSYILHIHAYSSYCTIRTATCLVRSTKLSPVRHYKGSKRGLVVGAGLVIRRSLVQILLPATRWICLRWPRIQLLRAV